MGLVVFALGFLAPASARAATIVDFNAGVPAGITLGGDMLWNGTGGGHVYMEMYGTTDYIHFTSPTIVNSFQMNSNPWQGYGYPTASSVDTFKVDLAALDAANAVLWSTTVDLSSYVDWSQWLTVNVGVANVSTLRFGGPGDAYAGYWPSIDNLAIDEALAPAVVPEPTSLLLLGTGIAGAVARARRRKQQNLL